MQTLTATCDNTPSIIAITILAFRPKLKLLPTTISLDLTTHSHGRDFIDAFFFVSSWYLVTLEAEVAPIAGITFFIIDASWCQCASTWRVSLT